MKMFTVRKGLEFGARLFLEPYKSQALHAKIPNPLLPKT